MPHSQIDKLVNGTSDVAFAVNSSTGAISAWNEAAENLFGISSAEAVGRPCHEIVQGVDNLTFVCSERCAIQQATANNETVANFDLEVQTKTGRHWCNVSIMMATEAGSADIHALHIVLPDNIRKRFEQLASEIVHSGKLLEPETRTESEVGRADAILTSREKQILTKIAAGVSTKIIARDLSISIATVNNHVRHILTKLSAHSRLEAIRYAEQAGLVRAYEVNDEDHR